jgi:hypothetical protein
MNSDKPPSDYVPRDDIYGLWTRAMKAVREGRHP